MAGYLDTKLHIIFRIAIRDNTDLRLNKGRLKIK